MKKTFLIVILLTVTTLTAFSRTKQESIKELFCLMQTESIFERMVMPLQKIQKNNTSNNPTDATDAIDALVNSFKPLFKKIMDEDMVELYDKYYSQKEIKVMIRFYKSKTGQKMVNTTPELQNDMMQIIQTKYMREFLNNVMIKQ